MKNNKLLAIDLEHVFIKSNFLSEYKWKNFLTNPFKAIFSKTIKLSSYKFPLENFVFNTRVIDYCYAWKSKGGQIVLYTTFRNLELNKIKKKFSFIDDIILLKKN